jgi:hypothetical protein
MGADDIRSCKDFHGNRSLTLLAICNAKYVFWWMSDIYCGATHDARIWRNSNLFRDICSGVFPPEGAQVQVLGIKLRPCVTADAVFAANGIIVRPLTSKYGLSLHCVECTPQVTEQGLSL